MECRIIFTRCDLRIMSGLSEGRKWLADISAELDLGSSLFTRPYLLFLADIYIYEYITVRKWKDTTECLCLKEYVEALCGALKGNGFLKTH